MRSRLLATLSFALLASLAPIAAQEEIPRTEYIRFVPLRYPRPVRQTAASVELQLFGDTAAADYVDVAPRDGIDDHRAATLHALAARFSPLLVRNTTNVPMNWRRFREQGKPFPLFVDTWETATTPPQLLRSVQIDLGDPSLPPCPPSGLAVDRLASNDDCAVLALLRDFDPDSPAADYYQHTAVSSTTVPFSVIYFDFPGYGPASWRAEYEARFSRRLPRRYDHFARIYAHPFVSRRGADGGYELLFQFWFFYPLNDGANKHEGDWEHLNVAIAPRSKVDRPLTAADVRAILEQARDDSAADPLVIRPSRALHSRSRDDARLLRAERLSPPAGMGRATPPAAAGADWRVEAHRRHPRPCLGRSGGDHHQHPSGRLHWRRQQGARADPRRPGE